MFFDKTFFVFITFKIYEMKKIKLIIFLLGMVSFVGTAQAQTKSAANAATVFSAKMDAIKSCGDLQNQLIRLCGDSYSLNNKKVVSQLEKNIDDQDASFCIRKSSLFAIYGDDYAMHLNRISQAQTSIILNKLKKQNI